MTISVNFLQFRHENQVQSKSRFSKEAIKNVVDLFDGIGEYHVKFSMGSEITPNLPEDEDLEDDFLLENLQLYKKNLIFKWTQETLLQ